MTLALHALANAHRAAGNAFLAEFVATEVALRDKANRTTDRDATPGEFFPLSDLVE